MSEEHEHGHELTGRSVGHVHGINQSSTVSADIVRCACGTAPPVIGIAIAWQQEDEDGGQHVSAGSRQVRLLPARRAVAPGSRDGQRNWQTVYPGSRTL